jgi:hypothetical protein
MVGENRSEIAQIAENKMKTATVSHQ